MGKHLGSLGTARAERTETFDYLDLPGVRVHPDMTDLLMVDFMLKARSIDENDVSASMAAIHGLFGHLVHPDDFEQFWAAALRGRQSTRDLMGTVYQIVEGLSERPTKRRPASSAGRRSTGRKSKDDLSSRVITRLERSGRPDLALIVTRARGAQRAG